MYIFGPLQSISKGVYFYLLIKFPLNPLQYTFSTIFRGNSFKNLNVLIPFVAITCFSQKTHRSNLHFSGGISLYEIINKLHFPLCCLFVRHFHWANNSEADKKQSLCCSRAYLYSKYNMLWQSFQRLPLHKALSPSPSPSPSKNPRLWGTNSTGKNL